MLNKGCYVSRLFNTINLRNGNETVTRCTAREVPKIQLAENIFLFNVDTLEKEQKYDSICAFCRNHLSCNRP